MQFNLGLSPTTLFVACAFALALLCLCIGTAFYIRHCSRLSLREKRLFCKSFLPTIRSNHKGHSACAFSPCPTSDTPRSDGEDDKCGTPPSPRPSSRSSSFTFECDYSMDAAHVKGGYVRLLMWTLYEVWCSKKKALPRYMERNDQEVLMGIDPQLIVSVGASDAQDGLRQHSQAAQSVACPVIPVIRIEEPTEDKSDDDLHELPSKLHLNSILIGSSIREGPFLNLPGAEDDVSISTQPVDESRSSSEEHADDFPDALAIRSAHFVRNYRRASISDRRLGRFEKHQAASTSAQKTLTLLACAHPQKAEWSENQPVKYLPPFCFQDFNLVPAFKPQTSSHGTRRKRHHRSSAVLISTNTLRRLSDLIEDFDPECSAPRMTATTTNDIAIKLKIPSRQEIWKTKVPKDIAP